MSQILTTRLKNHITTSVQDSISIEDCKNNESKILSRGIVAICLAGVANTNKYSDIAKYLTDGGQDNAIDGVYYDNIKNKLFIIQGKWSTKGTGTIDTGSLRKFIAGVYELLNENWKKFNARFTAIKDEISKGIKKDPEIILVVAYNSSTPISHECNEIINEFLEENNSDGQEIVSFKIFDLRNLMRTIKAIKSGVRTDVEVNLLEWGEHKDPYYSVYGKISCADIAEWYSEHGDLLFSENIRNTLSDSDINLQIESTLTNQPKDFWYLNNGITAIADEIKRKPLGLGDQKDSSFWNVTNLKIVNGAQTTGSIFNVYEKSPNQLKQAYVHVKIISLAESPLDIATKITTATNTQNRVEAKDFLALDESHDSLSESFKKIGVQYSYRRGEKLSSETQGIYVQDLALLLAISSDSIANVVIAKRNAGSLTDPSSAIYKKLFSTNIDVNQVWDNFQKWKTISSILNKISEKLSGRDAQLAIHGNRFIEHIALNEQVNLDERTIAAIHGRLKNIIDEYYPESYLAVLFKNASKCEILKSHLGKL